MNGKGERMKNRGVAITGLGVVASNGLNIQDFYNNSMKGIRGINNGETAFDKEGLKTEYYGSITPEALEKMHPELDNTPRNRALKMALCAGEQAMDDAGLSVEDIRKMGGRCAFLTGSLCQDDIYLYELSEDETLQKSEDILYLSDFSAFMKEKLGVGGQSGAISSACSSGSVIIGFAYDLINSGKYDVVLVCGIDDLTKNNVYGFHALKSMSSGICHPLDEERDGINIGEGCGFMVMESARQAASRGANIRGMVKGYSMGNEAFHITRPDTSGDGFYASMKNALDNTGLHPGDIDYINMHGTGTLANDEVELGAICKLYEGVDNKPAVSSLKTLTGQGLYALSRPLIAIVTWNDTFSSSEPSSDDCVTVYPL